MLLIVSLNFILLTSLVYKNNMTMKVILKLQINGLRCAMTGGKA